jgi:hypothetical protein
MGLLAPLVKLLNGTGPDRQENNTQSLIPPHLRGAGIFDDDARNPPEETR